MLAIAKARSWITVLIVSAIGTLITVSGPERLIPVPLLSTPVPVPVVLGVVAATICVLPLQPPLEPLDTTFVRNSHLSWVRPPLCLAIASPPSVVAMSTAPEGAQSTELTRLLLLSAIALVAVGFQPEVAWMAPMTAGLVAVIVDGSNPARPVTQALQVISAPGAGLVWVIIWVVYSRMQNVGLLTPMHTRMRLRH